MCRHLRSLVYDPLLERTIIQTDAAKNSPSPAPGWARRTSAVCGVFALSGVMHELSFCYLTGGTSPQLGWLWFFAAQGPVCILEGMALPRKSMMPHHKGWACVHIVLTAIILELLAAPLFFQPTEESGLATAIVKDAIASFSLEKKAEIG